MRSVLFLRMNAEMRGAAKGRARRQGPGNGAVELAAELLLHQAEEFLDAHFVEHIFEPRLGAVGAVAVIDEYAHHRVGHLGGIGGPDHDAGIAGKTLVPGEPAETQPEPDAGFQPEAVVHLDGLEADIVGVFQDRNDAGAVEADIEFARQAVKRAVVEDVEVPFARIGARVDQLLRVDAGRWRAGDVADVVGAGAARAQAEVLHRLDHVDRVLGFDFADLQIGARCDMGVAAAVALGQIGDAGKLRGGENAVRHAQPAHVGVLVGRNVKQAEKAPAEIVRRLRIFVLGGEVFQPLVGVEGMLLALELLRVGQFAAGLEHAILRLERRRVGTDRLGLRRREPAGRAGQ